MILNKLNQNKKKSTKNRKISIAKETPPPKKKQMNVEVQIFPHKQFGYFL